MEARHAELQRATGVAIVVITVPRLEGEPIEDFAVHVGQQWGVGTRGQDRGLVLAFALEERRIFLATGYGVESFLPDGRVGRILDEYALPQLRRGDFSEALFQTSRALVQIVEQELGGSPAEGKRRDAQPLASLLAVLVFVIVAYLAVRHPRLFLLLLMSGALGGRGGGRRRQGGFRGGGFGSGGGFGGFGGGGFGGGGAGRGF